MKRILSVLLCMTLALGMTAALAGCGELPKITTADNNGTTIICTSFAAYALVAPLTESYTADGGDSVVTVQILGKPGQDMHSFEPAAQDILSLAGADVIVCTGSEGWLDAALKSSGNQNARVVAMMAACKTVEAEHDHDHDDDDHGGSAIIGQDEHVWLSVENAVSITRSVSKTLQLADEKNADIWRAHETKVCNDLTALRQEYVAMMESATKKTVVLADRHPFTYLFAELGLDCVAAFPGCSSETSASFATQTKLIEAVKENRLSHIFVIEGSDGKVAEVVSKETGAGILTLHSLQVVADYENTTYLDAMRNNLENLKKALQ